jgi:K+-transporting ATPase A subunit
VGYGLQPQNLPVNVNFGKIMILLNKLNYKNILSVKNQKMHATEYLPNVKVINLLIFCLILYIAMVQESK